MPWRRSPPLAHSFRRGYNAMCAEQSCGEHQRVADVVAVADVDELKPSHGAEPFFERHEVGQGLARMLQIAERVDDRHSGILGHLGDGFVRVGTQHDAVRPALHIS